MNLRVVGLKGSSVVFAALLVGCASDDSPNPSMSSQPTAGIQSEPGKMSAGTVGRGGRAMTTVVVDAGAPAVDTSILAGQSGAGESAAGAQSESGGQSDSAGQPGIAGQLTAGEPASAGQLVSAGQPAAGQAAAAGQPVAAGEPALGGRPVGAGQPAPGGQPAMGGQPVAGVCPDYTPRRQPLFGDLHVHTSFSFDSYGLRNPRSGPDEAYRYARGEPITIPPYNEDGSSTRPPIQLRRPLDFTAVTDHAEFIGEVRLCTTEGSSAYDTVGCANFRNSTDFEEFIGVDISFAGWGAALTMAEPGRPVFCRRPGVDCAAAQRDAWARLQEITEAAHAVAPCEFTALHGYEHTSTPGGAMNHRNVIFRTAALPNAPITALDANTWQALEQRLVTECNESADRDCEALAIPHNPNYSNGVLFSPTQGNGDPLDEVSAALRARMEPLVEMIQAKEESECRNGFTGYAGAEDEACNFEKRDAHTPICQAGQTPCGMGQNPDDDNCTDCLEECAPGQTGNGCISPLDYIRNVLKEGMNQWLALGINPFKLGFIGSTDTHNATPGNTDEEIFEGHHGFQDDEADEVLDDRPLNTLAIEPGPGGLAVVWAQENTRDSIFRAMQRRETYATSGTRPIVRFYGGVSVDLCTADDFVASGDAQGVPMGGDLKPVIDGGKVVLGVHAMQDPESTGLQQIHIIKTWID
ncbi:MAG: DUF3604 domain-containing protein, partial [Myxococcota bacterium]|nr:DUF3604 domain-containing protein [Myxococcota bacterium]